MDKVRHGRFAYLATGSLIFFALSSASLGGERQTTYEIDFLKTSELPTEWSFRSPGTQRGYLNTPKSIELSPGKRGLVISTDFTKAPFASGMVSTQDRIYFQGGYFEATVKLPRLSGNNCAFWMKSDRYDKVGPSEIVGVELDIFEYHRRTPRAFYGTVHTGGYGSAHRFVQRKFNLPPSVATFEPITFAVEWTKSQYVFYVAGARAGVIDQFPTWVPMYLILSCEPNRWAGPPPRDGSLIDEMEVHKIRVLQNGAQDERMLRR